MLLIFLCSVLCPVFSGLSIRVFSVVIRCLVYPMLPVSLGRSFLIAPSVFYNVYFRATKQTDAPFGVIVQSPEPMSIPRGSIEELLFELCMTLSGLRLPVGTPIYENRT